MVDSTVEDDSTDIQCSHRWKIDSPNGPTSKGVCLVCGATEEFKNSMPVSGWDRDGSKADKKNADKKNDKKSSTASK